MPDSDSVADLTRAGLVARVTALEALLAETRRLISTDALTGLPNRRALESRSGLPGWFVLVDLDGFKRAQDSHPRGHDFGDQVLREFAAFLSGTVRTGDLLAVRLGGDEFAVHVDSREGAIRVRDAVRRWRSADAAVTASAGIGEDLPSADAACYLDKERRRS